MTTHRDYLLSLAGRAIRGEVSDINVRADGSLRLLNAGKELMWTGYSPEAEYLKGLVVEVDADERPVDLVAACLSKFYNYTENAANDAAFFAALNSPGARPYFLVKADGSNLRSFVHPDSGEVQWATRGMLQAGMGNSQFGDFSAMARRVAERSYPALLDPALIGRYTVICELISPDNVIVTNYNGRSDLLVITVVDLETGIEMSRRQTVEFCKAHGLTPVEAMVPTATDFDAAVAELRAAWEGTDLEGTVVSVEVEGRPSPFRLKIKGARYLELMRLKNGCSIGKTREIAEANELCDVESFIAHLKAEMPELPEEVRMMYETHFAAYAAWETANRVEVERLIGLFAAHPLAQGQGGSAVDRRAFAMSVADLPEKWAMFKLLDAGPEGARPFLLKTVRRNREKLLGGDEPNLLDAGAA